MSELLPELPSPVFQLQQVMYALSVYDTKKYGEFIPHMEAHWDAHEETCVGCFATWTAMPWGVRIDMHNNYDTEKEE